MDIVYILGTGSVWQNNEIRFSLRSVEKNISDVGNVFVVGERPAFLKNAIHLPYKDSSPAYWRNAYSKTILACKDPRLSENFLFMNDDFFILKPITAETYPYYYNKKYHRMNNLNHAYFSAIQKARADRGDQLAQGVFNFAVHRPIRYNKKLYLEMPLVYKNSLSFSPRSFYCNYFSVPGVGCVDPLIYPGTFSKGFNLFIAELTDSSIASASGRFPPFQKWIAELFPKPSRYE